MDKKEYEWVKKTREILLEQCKELSSEELNKSFDFGFQSIKESLFHIAGCYNAWLGSFVLSKNDTPLYTSDEIKSMDIDDVYKLNIKSHILMHSRSMTSGRRSLM